jgi:hypothetical protein
MTPERKEKLLLAAEAAGYEATGETIDGFMIIGGELGWDPSAHFATAARLAFDCGMAVEYNCGDIVAGGCIEMHFIPGDHASFCLAVVEAAAEMGRKK